MTMSMVEAAEGADLEADPGSDLEIIEAIESNKSAQETDKRPRKHHSLVWKYFEKCTHGEDYACCTLCGGEYQHSNNTSNLKLIHHEV